MTQTESSERVEWREIDEGLVPFLIQGKTERRAVWAPQEGSQNAFLTCPVTEALYEGTRGPGKTDALLFDFLRDVGKGYGKEWRGILFRRTYPELADVIAKSEKWFPLVFPTAKYNRSEHFWEFPDGEKLFFRHFERESDYWKYHGHAYPWIGWEEITVWPTDKCYTSMFSCSRSTVPGIPCRIRATTNPYGVGHNWVKRRFRLPITGGHYVGKIIKDAVNRDGDPEPHRVAIHGKLEENRVLLYAQPNYIMNLRAAARNAAQLAAWIDGDWNIVAGGMFDDIWDDKVHVMPNFPLHKIPVGWTIDRSYDHGQSKPFSVGWWAESNGEPLEIDGRKYGTVRGDLIRVAEWYGWRRDEENEGLNMLASQIAVGIVERERDMGLAGRVKPGPADTSIYDDTATGEVSVATKMEDKDVEWERADKGPGSRKQGWQALRERLQAASADYREEPGLFVLERCEQFLRTFPVLPRDEKDMDDVDTDAEDHIGDECRYRVRFERKVAAYGSYR